MMYYWSCWFSYDELREAGANVILPVVFSMSMTVRRKPILAIKDSTDSVKNYMFTGDCGLDSFLKIKYGHSTAVISEDLFEHLKTTTEEFLLDNIKFKEDRRSIWNCYIDF